jgi:hypothetical protein
LKNNGVLNNEGEARRLVGEFRKLIGNQLQLAMALGMPVAARQALGITHEKSAVDVSAIRAAINDQSDEEPE